MTPPVQIQLTVEESLEFQRFCSYWDGILEGMRMASEKAKRMLVDEILAARTAPNSAEPPKDGV